MRVTVPARDPRPGAPSLRKGPWSIVVALPGTFQRLPEGGAHHVHGIAAAPGEGRPTAAELERLVDHVVSLEGLANGEPQMRSAIRALLGASWWMRHDVAAAIANLERVSSTPRRA